MEQEITPGIYEDSKHRRYKVEKVTRNLVVYAEQSRWTKSGWKQHREMVTIEMFRGIAKNRIEE